MSLVRFAPAGSNRLRLAPSRTIALLKPAINNMGRHPVWSSSFISLLIPYIFKKDYDQESFVFKNECKQKSAVELPY